VIATSRSESDKQIASRAGADEVLLTGDKLTERIRALAPDGVDHIVEVAFGAKRCTSIPKQSARMRNMIRIYNKTVVRWQ
jgi:NADPH:quinone reductase-like Zn-dependent oxidoreductase